MPTKNFVISYYVKDFPTKISLWVNISQKTTLQVTFVEALFVKKDMLSLKANRENFKASSSHKKLETMIKPPTKREGLINP